MIRHGVHQKMRRLDNLRSRLARVEADAAAGLVRLCFGGGKLWRGQYNLEANGYGSHEEWLAGWRAARDGEFFVLGSRDETGGCQLCVAGVAEDGSLTLRLRLPDCLAGEHGKYVVIEGVKFAYGHGQALAALQANLEFAECRRRDGEGAARATSLGQAISYRFKRDEKGWRVFVTTEPGPRARGDGPEARRDWSVPECRPLGRGRDRRQRQLPSSLAGPAGDLWQDRPSVRGVDWGCGCQCR